MKYIKDQYYKGVGKGNKKDMIYIWICGKDNEKWYSHRVFYDPDKKEDENFETNYAKNCSHGWYDNVEPSVEEIEWLNSCIQHNKYITYEESLKFNQNPKSDPELEQILIKLLT